MLSSVQYPAAAKSAMRQLPALCNGEKTGFQCTHYWALAVKMDAQNPENLRRGEAMRYCTAVVGDRLDLGDGGAEMAVDCNRFEPSDRAYDAAFEVFNPMTPEEAAAMYGPEDDALARQFAPTLVAENEKKGTTP